MLLFRLDALVLLAVADLGQLTSAFFRLVKGVLRLLRRYLTGHDRRRLLLKDRCCAARRFDTICEGHSGILLYA